MPSPRYQVYNLREIYHELGEYQFKVVLSPRFYRSGHDFRVEMADSANRPMRHRVDVWGRKINVSFTIDEGVADGVFHADIVRKDKTLVRLTGWCIKP